MGKTEPANALVDGTVPAGLTFGVHKDGTVGIGSYSLSPTDFLKMVAGVTGDPRFQAALPPVSICEPETEPKPYVGMSMQMPEPESITFQEAPAEPKPKRTRKAKTDEDTGDE